MRTHFYLQKQWLHSLKVQDSTMHKNAHPTSIWKCSQICLFQIRTMRALSKADLKPSRANMHGAASLWKEKQTLSLPPTCTQLVLCEKGKFALDGEFSKNAPYKQKIIFHLTSIGKMSRKFFFLPWTVGRWYLNIFYYSVF